MRVRNKDGFTLIELLVAMSILVIIVLIIGMFFQRASVVWDTGSRRAEMLLTGRAMADFMAQEMQQAIPGDFNANGASATFWMLGDAAGGLRATQKVMYASSGGRVTRNGAELGDGVSGLAFEEGPAGNNDLPLWVDIKVTVSNEVNDVKTYQSRASFPNRDRDRL